MLFEVKGITRTFGGLAAVRDVSFRIEPGEIVGLIGPNGAGKTTLFNVVTGFLPPTRGEVEFEGQRISGLLPDRVCQRGIGRTFQVVKPFGNMTTLQNTMVGTFFQDADPRRAKRAAEELLEFLGLAHRREALAKNLTIADRKRLELARALGTKPKLLLLDEVMAGLNPAEVADLLGLLREIRTRGTTLFVIEHIMAAIMAISDRILVLHNGGLIAHGPPRQVADDQAVIDAYLGERYLIA
ncbi:MAG: ABC transporter ATP-binding protein [Betaproteobacteria bacterium RIFCSPLOWO2_12_FULL_62_13b]|nr:MAG: ABC transporter ATP-binding protein [Betaproteobacteria bacterium RIFCSPLOWO2_12_FULL_62_13b]